LPKTSEQEQKRKLPLSAKVARLKQRRLTGNRLSYE